MAVEGTPLVLLYEHPAEPPEAVEQIPAGDMIEPYVQGSPPYVIVGAALKNRFPVGSSAGGFLVDMNYAWFDEEKSVIAPIAGFRSPYVIVGAVYPESSYIEPTQGQIWPRIG